MSKVEEGSTFGNKRSRFSLSGHVLDFAIYCVALTIFVMNEILIFAVLAPSDNEVKLVLSIFSGWLWFMLLLLLPYLMKKLNISISWKLYKWIRVITLGFLVVQALVFLVIALHIHI